jgi:hypothetical protein
LKTTKTAQPAAGRVSRCRLSGSLAGRAGFRLPWLGIGPIFVFVGLCAWVGFAGPRCAAAPSPAPAEERPPVQYSEEQVKAAILVAFAKTTEWPQGSGKDNERTIHIGIFGRDTLGEKATSLLRQPPGGKGRDTRFSVVEDEAQARQCHVLFVPRSERRRARELLEQLKEAPVLTVGESDDFLDLNGMVNLVPKDGVMKYEINLNAAKVAHLRIPAKVLSTAISVRGKYE